MNDIILENEKKANRWAYIVMLIAVMAGVLIQVFFFGAYSPDQDIIVHVAHVIVDSVIPVGIIIAVAIPAGKYYMKKYVIIIFLTVDICLYCVLNSAITFLLFFIPLLLSCRYYDRKLLNFTVIISLISMVIIWWGNAYYGFSLDLNLVRIEPYSTISIESDSGGWIDKSIMEHMSNHDRIMNNMLVALPEHLIFSLIYFAAFMGISKSGTQMMEKREQLARERAAIERDLKLASNIQLSMLSNNFDSYGGENRAEIYAQMYAAKTVGGDFYDFYMLDEDHVCVVIGDVSGKVMTASLFLVRALTCLKNLAQSCLSPDEILRRANNSLNESNTEVMFVTVWIGILDLNTGDLKYCVGGHNPPLLMRGGREFKYLEDDPNYVIAGIPNMEYKLSGLKMEKGDKLFLYTDGVTESVDTEFNEYGEEALNNFLNANKEHEPKKIIDSLKVEISEYSKGCEQFDDITMLCLEYK